MKAIPFFTLLIVFLLTSCGGNKNQEKEPEEILNDLEKSLDESFDDLNETQKFKNCDDFLKNYEEWNIAYLEFLEQYLKNPTDVELLNKYTKILEEASNWAMDWTDMIKCSSQEKYQKRFEEISNNTQKKLEELGLG